MVMMNGVTYLRKEEEEEERGGMLGVLASRPCFSDVIEIVHSLPC